MKSFVFSAETGNRFFSISSQNILTSLLLLIFAWQQMARGQTDDFNDGNDTGWVRFGLDSAGLPPASYSFPDYDGFNGQAYRIFVSAPPIPDAGPARAFSYRTNQYDNFYLAVDVVTWDNTLNQAFGFLIRASNIGLGQTDGYVMNYDPNQQTGGRGQFQINRVDREAPADPLSGSATANITLDPTHRYRFVLTGAGSTLTGHIYDFSDLTTPLVTISADDDTYPSGVLGLFTFSRVGAADYTNPNTGKADVTFDNYYASTAAPAPLGPQGTPHPVPHMPQVANRAPDTQANFYPYTNGISFTATTLTTNAINTSAVKIFLNGANVSSGLAMSGSASNVDVAFNGLASNMVYDARIVLSDFSGRTTTNEFTFDTFDESDFDSPAVKVIEAEDYNYDSGQFQDNPPASGVNGSGQQVNGFGVGYFDLIGTTNVDYLDYSTSPGSGVTPEYRTADFVGTQAGSAEIDNAGLLNDTIRGKYTANNYDLPEYEVRGTEGGEWLNYTRVFSNANYCVYLREACRAPQAVYLDQVSSDRAQTNQTTVRLGVFNVPSTAILINYRYVTLTDTNGNPVALNLSGTNTLRLTLGGPRTNVTQNTMVLNYLVFVPVIVPQIVLESSSDVAVTFAPESTATIDTGSKTITAPLNGNVRFYRIRSSTPPALTITSVRIVGANVVMDYR